MTGAPTGDGGTIYRFRSVEARDSYLAEHFPNRVQLSLPGCYHVPGALLIAFLEALTVYPDARMT